MLATLRRRIGTALLSSILLLLPLAAHSQPVHAWEGSITISTYRLGPPDPNPPFPLVNEQPVYPYPMLDDLGNGREPKSWRAIFLENQFLKVIILPELGGHVYSVYDKVHHREMLYRNQVIKYGLVGPRGAWIAGGMEFSFPFAHTTDTVSTVSSALHHNVDGSSTALVGAIDWVSDMYWQIAITLRPDAARIEEGVALFNATPLSHLYLFWTNTAVPASNDLQYIYPMRETISDDPFAIVQSWPVWNDVDQSWYRNNSGATAIFAREVKRNFFGVYYHRSNYGVVHVSDYREDPGKKLWSWGTARSGRIWDTILSDTDGPYNEIQSGRFATQGYREFMEPDRVEQWTEYWYPVSDLNGGFVEATSQMALNVAFAHGQAKLLFSPVAPIRHATIAVSVDNAVLRTIPDVELAPLHPATYSIPVPDVERARKQLHVKVRSPQGRTLLEWSASQPIDGNPELTPLGGKALATPVEITPTTPIEQLYLQGVFLEKRGNTEAARRLYDQALAHDPGFVPALLQQAFFAYRAADFASARRMVDRASNREDENPVVFYLRGLIDRAEGDLPRAVDAFWSTIHYGPAFTPGLSLAAAYLQLGEIAIQRHDYAAAMNLLQQAIDREPGDTLALTDLAAAQRLGGDRRAATASSEKALALMPLLPYALVERWLDAASPATLPKWSNTIGSDPQNYLAIAAWYHQLGDWPSSDAILHAAITSLPAQSRSPMLYYYLAANSRQQNQPQQADHFAAQAATLSIEQVFPNTLEDAAILSEALQHNPHDTHAAYALGNFLFAHARYDEAATLWSRALGQQFDNPVLQRNLGVYEWRVKKDLAAAAGHYSQAIQLSPHDYRLYEDLDKIYEQQENASAREKLFRDAPAAILDRDTVRARHALYFLEQRQPDQTLALLRDHRFKPWEGGVIIHNIFVRANIEKGRHALALHQPIQAMEDFRAAMEYPEELGTGRPIQPNLSEQLYWLGVSLDAQGKTVDAKAAWRSATEKASEAPSVFAALAYRNLGDENIAEKLLQRCIEPARSPSATAHDFFAAALAELYLGHKERAEKYFRQTLTLDPLFWEARVTAAEEDL
jgi:tetratricopeptide (TPR) repeat protein